MLSTGVPVSMYTTKTPIVLTLQGNIPILLIKEFTIAMDEIIHLVTIYVCVVVRHNNGLSNCVHRNTISHKITSKRQEIIMKFCGQDNTNVDINLVHTTRSSGTKDWKTKQFSVWEQGNQRT
jgi:hypothetical protein